MPLPGKQILNYISKVTITMRGLGSKDTSTNLEFSGVLSAVRKSNNYQPKIFHMTTIAFS